jgi:hypothetical protein
MWEFYLAPRETAFRRRECMVVQTQLARPVDAAPLTGGYMRERSQAA